MPTLMNENSGEEWRYPFSSFSSPHKGGADEEGAGVTKNDRSALSPISPNIKSTSQKPPSSTAKNNAVESAIAIGGGGENLLSNSKDGMMESTKSTPGCVTHLKNEIEGEKEGEKMAADDVPGGLVVDNLVPGEAGVAVNNCIPGEGKNTGENNLPTRIRIRDSLRREVEKVDSLHREVEKVFMPIEKTKRLVPPKEGKDYIITTENSNLILTIITDAWGKKDSVEKYKLCEMLVKPFYPLGFSTVQLDVQTHDEFNHSQSIVEKHCNAKMICEFLEKKVKELGAANVGKSIAANKSTKQEYDEMQGRKKSAGKQKRIATVQKPSPPAESVDTKIATAGAMMTPKKKDAGSTSSAPPPSSTPPHVVTAKKPKEKAPQQGGVTCGVVESGAPPPTSSSCCDSKEAKEEGTPSGWWRD